MNREEATRQAVERMMEARPVLVGLAKAIDIIPGMRPDLLLHAGPPIEWNQASGPLRGAITGALLFEGRARSEQEAHALVESGEIQLAPCHHHQAVGPMAGVISPSMSVYVVENKTHGNLAYSNLNEGYGEVLRYGAYSQAVLERLVWMESVMAPVLGRAIQARNGLDLRQLLSESLHMGDEGHNRNKAGSALFTQRLAPQITMAAGDPAIAAEIINALAENALSVLNPVMAACKAMTDVAHDVEGSSLVTVMARNGTEFGIRVSGLGEEWFTAPVAVPRGKYFNGFKAEDASGDIGDSTITETAGIGGFAMATAPAIVDFISGKPADAVEATQQMYEITLAEHQHFTMPPLDFRGTPTGIDLFKVVEKEITPRVNTGIAHKEPGIGQIGAGLVRPPMTMFEQAAEAYQKRYSQ